MIFPSFGYRLASIYASVYASGAVNRYTAGQEQLGQATEGRIVALRDIGKPLGNALFATRSPLRLANPFSLLFVLVIIVAICTLLSGYRSALLWMAMMAIASALAHRRSIDILLLTTFGVPVMASLIIMQGTVFELPMAAQRALSFLPGKWNQRAVLDAEGSIEWRVEMWKLALGTDRYISNKIIGDGFGFSRRELMYQLHRKNPSSPEELQEYFLITGGYHSGPVETIRRVGYVGLGVLFIGMVLIWREAMKLTRRSRGTPYQWSVFFVTLPTLVLPFYFTFVFGSYQATFANFCIFGGMMRMLENSMDLEDEKSTGVDEDDK
jgi:hypothetical protein